MIYRLSEILSPELPQQEIVAAAPDWTREAFNRRVSAVSQALREHGADTVALWFADSAWFACALLAAWHSGAKVLLPPNAAEDNRRWAAEQGAFWLHDTENGAPFGESARYLPGWAETLPEMPSENRADYRLNSECELFLKTSGSSGQAQIVRKTVADLENETLALAATLPFEHGASSVVGSVSPQHLYGLTFRFALPLAMGWTMTREQNVYPETLLAATAGQAQPCIWIASPALLNRMGVERNWAAVRPKLRGIVSSGGALPQDTAALLAENAILPWEIYGSTETGAIAARQGGGVWRTLNGVQAAQQEDGTLHIASPWSGGVREMADVVQFSDGGFTLLGRKDRIIKFEDKRVSLAQIEQDLLRHEWIADAYCCLHPKYKRLAVWAALNSDGIEAFASQGRAAVATALKRHLAKSQDTAALPRYWRFAAELPRNTQSKITAADVTAAFTEAQKSPQWRPSENTQEGVLAFEGIVPLDLVYFGGHFAQFPLVPGVIELQWVRDLAQASGWRDNVVRVENLKYQQFVRPNDYLRVELAYDESKHKLSFKILKSDGAGCASGRMVFGTFDGAVQ
ncbi:MAG: AMP-binding protein [Neisseria sp.]|nr:AMP-binding protein [Neisseria sp.]